MAVWQRVVRGLWLWAPALACAALIQYYSIRPAPAPAELAFLHLDKILHAGAYGLLALLLARALGGSWHTAPRIVALHAALWATGYGAGQELVQRFLAGRTADLGDLLANGAGAAAAGVVWTRAIRWWDRRAAAPAPAVHDGALTDR